MDRGSGHDGAMGRLRRLRWLWARLGDISLAKDLALLVLGGKGAAALAVAAVTAALGYADHLPLATIFLLSILAFAATVWGWMGVAALSGRLAPKAGVARMGSRGRRKFAESDDLPFDRPELSVTPGRKPYLIFERPELRVEKDGNHLLSSDCFLTLRSSSPVQLDDCRVVAMTIRDNITVIKLDRPLMGGGAFSLRPGATKNFQLVTRDLAEIVKRPPHHLLLDSKSFPLPDNNTFMLQLVVTSNYEFKTTANLIIRTGRDEHLEVEIRDQFV